MALPVTRARVRPLLGASDQLGPDWVALDIAEHAQQVAERINHLGGKPDFNPEGLASRAASEYGRAESLVDMIKENLVAERIAIEHYQELIRYFANEDPGTRAMLEGILVVEEEHANDMSDLLVAHESQPMTSN